MNIKHFHINLNGANQTLLGDPKVLNYVSGRLKELFPALTGDVKCVLHCAAGMHRTGTIGYTLLRMSGYQA